MANPKASHTRRAWEALLAADPEVAGHLAAAVGVRSSGSTSIATPTTTAAPVDLYAFGPDDIIFASWVSWLNTWRILIGRQ